MLWPPGHSSWLNSIGQFSMVILRPWSWAKATMSGQTRSASSQFSSWCLRPVAAHERVDERDAHLLGGGDDLLEVADDLGPMGRVRMERVRVVAEPGDGQALRRDLVDDLGRLAGRQVGDVDVRRAGVAPGRPGRARPAGDLEALEARRRPSSRRRPSAASRGTGRSAGRVSSGRVLRAAARARPERRPAIADDIDPAAGPGDSAMASLTSISSWPSANVGYGRAAAGPPATTSA